MPRQVRAPRVLRVEETGEGIAALTRRLRGMDVALLAGGRGALPRMALAATLAGVRAVVVAPTDGPWPLPWWHRRIARLLLPDQETARAWRVAGVPLGRLVVVADPEALDAVLVEVAEMGR